MARLSYPFKYSSSFACRNNDAILQMKKYIGISDSLFGHWCFIALNDIVCLAKIRFFGGNIEFVYKHHVQQQNFLLILQ